MAGDSAGAQLKITRILGGSKSRLSGQEVRGGRITVAFGGCDVDLRGTTLPDGEAEIKLTVIGGGVKLLLPEGWAVNVQTAAVIGGINDKRVAPASPSGRLTLTGFCLFGGIEIP